LTTKVGINGFGRIGRLAYKAILQRHKGELEVTAINDLTDPNTNRILFKYDTNYGVYPGTVDCTEDSIVVDGRKSAVVKEKDPAKIPWSKYGVDIVIESTGLFTDADKAAAHLQGGAKRVIVSAPSKGDAKILVVGVNHTSYDPAKHKVLSNASCTTNGIAPLVKVLHEKFGIVHGLMTTVHSYTNDQKIQDTVHKDLRRARAAAVNIIPTTTGAAAMMGIVIPDLKGKLDGMALRVPVSSVSVVDFVADLKRRTTVEEVNEAFLQAANGSLKHILHYCDEPLVSSDHKGDPHSSIFDSLCTMVLDGTQVKVIAWYDNEWGYSCRLGDLTAYVASRGA